MLAVGWVVLAVAMAVLLTIWITFTLTRLDRLHARCDAAQAALDAQLVRRAAALQHVAESPDSGVDDVDRPALDTVARAALDPQRADWPGARQGPENAVGRSVTELAERGDPLRADVVAELQEAATRVLIARRFYNDAVRDTRALRARRLPRLLHMAGHRALPEFFDIDDTVPHHGVSAPPRPVPVPVLPAPVATVSPTEQDLHD